MNSPRKFPTSVAFYHSLESVMKSLLLLSFVAFSCAHSPFNKHFGHHRSINQSWSQSFPAERRNGTLQGGNGVNAFDTVFQWNIMDFEYPTPQARANAIAAQQFIPQNVVPLGIAAAVDRVFVTTPRWKEGIPASLSVIDLPAFSQSPALVPYPSWDAQTPTNNPDCTRLLSVYRMAIDECNRLWVIDSGIVNALTNLQQLCPPKIVAFDLTTDQQILTYQFPANQVLQGSLHTNLVVDIRNGECNRAFVYVMDVWRNGILVFDMGQGTSWRTQNYLYNPDPFASDYNYRGINFQWTDGVFGASLSPLNKPAGDRVLYYHPMSSFNEFMVRTSILRNQTAWVTSTAPATAFQSMGSRGRRGQSSTTDMTPNGILLAAQVQLEGVSCWDTRKPYNQNNVMMVQRDPNTLGFVNDLKLDTDRENVWVVSNNLPIYLYSQLDFSQINFRLLRANVARATRGTICDPQVVANTEPINVCPIN